MSRQRHPQPTQSAIPNQRKAQPLHCQQLKKEKTDPRGRGLSAGEPVVRQRGLAVAL